MKLHCYEDTDSLCIDLADGVSADLREPADGFVVDYDAKAEWWGSTFSMLRGTLT